jgi:hypothetical protein
MVKRTLKNKNMKMKIYIILLALAFSACKKEPNISSEDKLKGKLKTLTDNTLGLDTFYFFYDSISGKLNKTTIASQFLSSSKYIATIDHETGGNIKVSVYWNDINTLPVIWRIYTNGKQITSIEKISDTSTNLLNTSTKIYLNSAKVDSVVDKGTLPDMFFADVHNNGFSFNSGNCNSYNSVWTQYTSPFTPNYIQIFDTINFYYTTLINTNKLRYQIPIDINIYSGYSYWFILFLVQLDGYYILPFNNNLIDSITNRNTISKYSYEFDNESNISKVKIKLRSNLGSIETEKEQHMTYY